MFFFESITIHCNEQTSKSTSDHQAITSPMHQFTKPPMHQFTSSPMHTWEVTPGNEPSKIPKNSHLNGVQDYLPLVFGLDLKYLNL